MSRPLGIGMLRVLSLLLALAWMAVIYYLSSQTKLDTGISLPGLDKLLHAGAYGLLGGLFLTSQPRIRDGYSRRQAFIAASLASLYGLTDEWHQSFVPGRTADGWDLLADAGGALLAVWLIRRRFKPRPIDTETNP